MPGRELDLSGRWSGIYNYPRGLPPVAFEAVIQDNGGAIIGETTETESRLGTLHALIDGHRAGSQVRFVKTYDDLPRAMDPVAYDGTIAESGDEIHGRWHLAGDWSGTFLMVREGGAKQEERRREQATIPV